MLGKAAEDWLACSPDGVAFIDLRVLGLAGSSESQQFAISSVEIKTYVAETTLDRAIAHSSADIITCSVGDVRFRELIPTEHVGQIMHQMVVLSVNYVIYVAASDSGVLFTAVIYCDATVLQTCYTALAAVAGPVVSWAHLSDPQVPSFADTESGKTLRSRLSFWLLVNTYVRTKDAFPPLKLFKHSSQSLYSKTKGGVNGSAQARAILRSSTSALKWEQKIVSQTLKTLTINAFIAWRMSKNRALLQSKEAFRNLSAYRHTLNTTQSMADFVFDLARELVVYADSLVLDGEEQGNSIALVGDEELRRLCDLAKKRKRKLIQFFNGEDIQTLRLKVARHTVKQQQMQQYCGLCGLNVKQGSAGEWRGHRSTYKCIECDVHLCVRIYPGLRKSCSELWHSVRVLAPRATPRPTSLNGESQVGGVSNNLA